MTNLTPTQIRALQVLSQHEELSYAGLEEKGVKITTDQMSRGTVDPETGEASNPDSLESRKYVRRQEETGLEITWRITPSGEQAAKKYKTRTWGDNGQFIPRAMLRDAALFVKSKRHYGIEKFTPEDLAEVRARLSETYRDVPDDGLIQQMANMRKQGVFSDSNKKQRMSLEKVLREFGPEGTMIRGLLTTKQIAQVEEQLDILASLAAAKN